MPVKVSVVYTVTVPWTSPLTTELNRIRECRKKTASKDIGTITFLNEEDEDPCVTKLVANTDRSSEECLDHENG